MEVVNAEVFVVKPSTKDATLGTKRQLHIIGPGWLSLFLFEYNKPKYNTIHSIDTIFNSNFGIQTFERFYLPSLILKCTIKHFR